MPKTTTQTVSSGTDQPKKSSFAVMAIVGTIGGVFLLGGLFFIVIGAAGLFIGTNGQHLDGVFVAEQCGRSIGRTASSAYECGGTFTPDNTALQPVHFDPSHTDVVHVSRSLELGTAYRSYALVTDLAAQPTVGDQVVIAGDSGSKSSPIIIAGTFLVLGLIAIPVGIKILLLFRSPRPPRPATPQPRV